MSLSHVLLRNPRLKGWEYGMLRALEHEIVRQTNAKVIDIPDYGNDILLKKVCSWNEIGWSKNHFS